jgi:hypothetical protein
MKRLAKLALGSVAAVLVVLGLFLLPIVPISVGYVCNGNASECAQLSYSTFVSVTYASFHVGAVYVKDNSDGTFSQYCWMQGDPVGNPSINGGAMCGSAVG